MTQTNELIKGMASEWADKFAQGLKRKDVEKWVGLTVEVSAPPSREDGPAHHIIATIAGYTHSVIFVDDVQVEQFSLITDEGIQFPIFAGFSLVSHVATDATT